MALLRAPIQALRFDGSFAPAWVAYGHAFAQHDESDQALAASLGLADIYHVWLDICWLWMMFYTPLKLT